MCQPKAPSHMTPHDTFFIMFTEESSILCRAWFQTCAHLNFVMDWRNRRLKRSDLLSVRRHLHYLWNTNMTAWLHHGNDPPQELNCLTYLGRRTSHIGKKTKLSSLSIDRQLKFKITAWPKLGNKAAGNGNMSIKCTGSYFTAVKASSCTCACVYDS